MDFDHEAYPEEMTIQEYVDGLSESERQGNMLYEQVMRERAEGFEQEEAEDEEQAERHRVWADKAHAERLARESTARIEAGRKRDEDWTAMTKTATELGKTAATTAAVGLGVVVGVALGIFEVIFGNRDKRS